MLLRIAELQVDPARIAEYRRALARQVQLALRDEPGVLFLIAAELADHPGAVRVTEGYADADAYARHLQAPHFLAYKAETAGMVLGLTLIETNPVAIAGRPVGVLPERNS